MAFTITAAELKAMQAVDPMTVDRSMLVDIKDVQINTTLSKAERMADFIQQIKNPYCYKCGKVVVKINYSEKEITLEQQLINHFRALV